jgi:DHA3 family macrolide efflux protein-like MFS transporter
MALFLNFLLVPIESLMPLLVTKHFGKGAIEFGIINSVSGAGIIAGGILLGVSGGFKKKIITSMTAIVGLGVAVLLIGVAPANLFILAIAGSIMLGFMSPLANGPLGALLQTII